MLSCIQAALAGAARVLDQSTGSLWVFGGVEFNAREIEAQEAASLVPVGFSQGLEFATVLQCGINQTAFVDGLPKAGDSLTTGEVVYRIQGVARTPNDHQILIFLAVV